MEHFHMSIQCRFITETVPRVRSGQQSVEEDGQGGRGEEGGDGVPEHQHYNNTIHQPLIQLNILNRYQ